MLYDTTADVIRKALRGLNLAPATAAFAANLDEREVLAASRGEPSDSQILEKLAVALALDPMALAALADYEPKAQLPAGVRQIEMPFDDETVNAWLVQVEGATLLFDTGEESGPLARVLDELSTGPVEVFITHSHDDHVGGLVSLGSRAVASAGPAGTAKEVLSAGESFQRGPLTVRVIDLPGHCDGAIGYVIEGMDAPLCVVGDALFAGSMGGCAAGRPYHSAIEALRAEVLILPDETVILTGHGPATTVGQEKRANVFAAITRLQ